MCMLLANRAVKGQILDILQRRVGERTNDLLGQLIDSATCICSWIKKKNIGATSMYDALLSLLLHWHLNPEHKHSMYDALLSVLLHWHLNPEHKHWCNIYVWCPTVSFAALTSQSGPNINIGATSMHDALLSLLLHWHLNPEFTRFTSYFRDNDFSNENQAAHYMYSL